MSAPKVSLLIPTCNRSKLLRQALDSALAQDYPNLEVIVADNASTDDTPALRESYQRDARVRWHRQPRNVGLAANWRSLVYELATGEYGKILADDDYLHDPSHVSKAMALAGRHKAVAVFAGAGVLIEPGGRIFSVDQHLPERMDPRWWLENFGRRRNKLFVFPNFVPGVVFHLQKARELGAFIDPVFGMDYELGMKLMLSGPTAYVGGLQVIERSHPDNDGARASLQLIWGGFELFERVRRHAAGLGIGDAEMAGFLFRGRRVFVDAFLLRAWFREKGAGLGSGSELYAELAKIDPRLARATALSPRTYVKAGLAGSPEAYHKVKAVYRRLTKKSVA